MIKRSDQSSQPARDKVQAKPRKTREPRKVIVSFRLRKSEADLLCQSMTNTRGIKSLKQYCRKVAIDYAYGRIVYVHRVDKELDPDSSPLASQQLGIQPPNCQMADPKFVKALMAFLDKSPENWNQLRFFMMSIGWPEQELADFRKAKSDEECLNVAKRLLKKMAVETNKNEKI